MWNDDVHELHTPYFFSHILIFLDNNDRKSSRILVHISWWRRVIKKTINVPKQRWTSALEKARAGRLEGQNIEKQKIKNHKSYCNPKEGKKLDSEMEQVAKDN